MKQRMVTGALAGALFILLLWLGGLSYSILIALLALIGFYEYLRMVGLRMANFAAIIGWAGILYFILPWEELGVKTLPQIETASWFLMLLFFFVTVISKNKKSIDRIALLFLGTFYIGIGFHFMLYTRFIVDGLFWTFLVFACIWITDSGAYFCGKWFGKHLLWPEISPKKTIEGAIGGLIFAIFCALLFSLYSPDLLPWNNAIILAIIIAIAGQIGDLIQSAYKRFYKIKDTGNILPGHGGVLDRCDSWLIVFPLVSMLSLIG